MTTQDVAQLSIGAAPAHDGAAVEVRLTGAWTVQGSPNSTGASKPCRCPKSAKWWWTTRGLSSLDTSGAWMLHRTLDALKKRGCPVRVEGLRPEFDSLLALIGSREIATGAPAAAAPSRLERVGRRAMAGLRGTAAYFAFVGESFIALLRSIAHPRRFRWRAILHNMQTAGFDALPIAGLLSFLMGIVIAYQGAEQLQRFGANIFVVDLVGAGDGARMSPLLTAIIVAGRSGSAYTAQIGTMKVTEEIDALRTIGVAPQELLVLPKVLALVVALPLLTVYTDIIGVLGGMVMARRQARRQLPRSSSTASTRRSA